MKKLLVAMTVFAALSAAAQAGLVCASAPELKVLQSTALQQQLMVAALSCHMREDYGRFVAAYRDGLMQSDAALKAFFTARPRGEDYNAYKTRIANAVSLHSVRDPRFCDSARKVFDMALGRRLERRGLAPEPPQLVETGYEGCRAVDNRLIEAKAQPAAKVALVPKPAPRPAHVPVKLAAASTVRLLASAPVPTAKPIMPVEVSRAYPHVAIALPKPAPKPVKMATAAPKTPVAVRPAMATKSAVAPTAAVNPAPAAKPVQIATAAPKAPVAVKPAMAAKPMAGEQAVPPASEAWQPRIASTLPPFRTPASPSSVAPPDRTRWRSDSSALPSADEDPSLFERSSAVAEPPRRELPTARQGWRQPQSMDPDDPYANNPIPSAYRPGAEWVGDDGAWRAPPRWGRYDRPPPPRGYWVHRRDGRWTLIIPSGPRWARD